MKFSDESYGFDGTSKDVDGYFTRENFVSMFGECDLSDAELGALRAEAHEALDPDLEADDGRLLRVLGTITTRDGAGRHFTEVFNGDDLAALESEGFIEIHRPVHEATGIAFSHEYSSVLITEAGQYEVDAALERGFDFNANEEETMKNYEYETDERLPEGWELAIAEDGSAMVCSPGTCPRELGEDAWLPSREEAIEDALDLIRRIA